MAYPQQDWTDDSATTTRASSVVPENGFNAQHKRSDNAALRKSVLERKHGELDESKESDSLKRLRYLLSLTDVFRHFIDSTKNPKVKELLAQIDRENEEEQQKAAKGHARTGGAVGGRHRRTEQEEDAELLRDEKRGGIDEYVFRESPPFVENGEMRDYQIAGLNWLVSLHNKGLSGILADEMGLGKTLQTVAFLGYLRYIAKIRGPHLVTVPKSTLDNWHREFSKWTPEVRVLVLQGTKEERADIIADRIATEDFDVLITSYEMILREKSALKKLAWQYIIVDEAHRIKNENSSLAQIIRDFHSRGRLLITGTPLQNNLHELWALLNFLLPDVFEDSEVFDSWFSGQNEDQDTVIKQLHRVLRPFLLRRVKNDVEKSLLPKKEINLYIGMSEMQIKWYKKILEKDIEALNGQTIGGKRESKTRLLNIVMQLRKCCNHPYLFDGAEPGPPYTTDEHLITNAGKMVMLDKLLTRFKQQGSRVLIFSQMSRVLDILEDYSVFRDHKYCRIDGSTQHEDRIKAIDDYNAPGSEKFLFLLTTRAGGLGINLTTADIVILFDSDWNPQADLQAMDRAHRIGQTKQVYVYRFVTESAIEEKVLERAAQKLRLDQLVIQQGRAEQNANKGQSSKDLLDMIQHGAAELINGAQNTDGPSVSKGLTDDDIEAILRQGEAKTAELNAKYEKLGLDELQTFTSENAYQWNGEDFSGIKHDKGLSWIAPSKRERKEQSYSTDLYYRQALHPNVKPAEPKIKAPRAPKQIQIHDWQFFPEELALLQDRETAYFRKEIGFKAPLPDNAELSDDEKEAQRAAEQAVIDQAEPLTEAEQEEKARLSELGFSDWAKREFQQFIAGCAKHGRSNWFSIAQDIEGKTEKEVKTYGTTFFKRIKELPDHARYLSTIETGEAKAKKVEQQRKMLRKKMEMYRVPLQQLKLNYSVSTTNKKVYTEEEDRFILVMLDRHGLDNENIHEIIRDEIRESPLFRFDWFVLSRTPQEIARRCTTLLTTVEKEFEMEKENKAPASNGVKSRPREEPEEEAEEEDDTPPKKKAKTAVKNKVVETVKQEAKKPKTNGRSPSVGSNGIKTPTGKGKKK